MGELDGKNGARVAEVERLLASSSPVVVTDNIWGALWSKLIIIFALAKAGSVAKWTGYYWLAGLTVLVSFLTLLSFVKVQRYALQGEVKPELAGVREVPGWMCAAMIILAVVCFGAGVLCPFIQSDLFEPAREALMTGLTYSRLALGG